MTPSGPQPISPPGKILKYFLSGFFCHSVDVCHYGKSDLMNKCLGLLVYLQNPKLQRPNQKDSMNF